MAVPDDPLKLENWSDGTKTRGLNLLLILRVK